MHEFRRARACARLPRVSQSNPVRIFVTHAWENSDDYLRVFEYLESQRNFFYKNYSTPERRPQGDREALRENLRQQIDRKSTRLNSSHGYISYAVFCLKKKKKKIHCAR